MPKKPHPIITKLTPKHEDTLRDLLVQKLQALYDIEQELVKTLPKLARKSSDAVLEQCFEDHLEETKEHVVRLERAFTYLEETPKKLKSSGIRGITDDINWVMKNVKGDDALDINLIAAARYAEHYEIAGYTVAREWAEVLNEEEVCDLLLETLEEEQTADENLADAAEDILDRILRA